MDVSCPVCNCAVERDAPVSREISRDDGSSGGSGGLIVDD